MALECASYCVAVKARDVKWKGKECFLVELLHVEGLTEDLETRLTVTYPKPDTAQG